MKIKKFESFSDIPEIGDYIIANNLDYNNFNSDVDDYLRITIGKISAISGNVVNIKYENIPKNIIKTYNIFKDNTCSMRIKYTTYAKTIEELKLKIQSQIYNI
jgi:hypothetical protein